MDEKVLAFSLKGTLAHFRQPDTTATHATYPFPPRPTIHGFLASLLGIDLDTSAGEEFLRGEHYIGLEVLNPVRTAYAQMSMLGKGFAKGEGNTFNRLTTIELLVSPFYTIYYSGNRLQELTEMIRKSRSVYHTYLGSAYCLTYPVYQGCYQASEIIVGVPLELSCVIPQRAVQEVVVEPGRSYAVARALPYRHTGSRFFEETVSLLYEAGGRPVKIIASANPGMRCKFIKIPGEKVVCLW